jgi:hypothetical protein
VRELPKKENVVAAVPAIRRALGYCLNTKCEEHAKGVFLLNYGNVSRCRVCRTHHRIVPERAFHRGHGPVVEVRVEWGYNPLRNDYDNITIVREEDARGGTIVTFQSPVTRTEKRSFRIAEATLANMRMGLYEEGEFGSREVVMTFDEPIERFSAQCEALGKRWERAEQRGGV